MNTDSLENGFNSFNLKPALMKGITQAGFKTPSEVQDQAIPLVLDGRDVIAQAHTGTGKTAAFGLPVMNNMKMDGSIELLVITPTRELADQVSDELFRLGQFAGVKTGTVCGGRSYERQMQMFKRGIQVLTATPGRLIDLLKGGRIKNFAPATVVLDEADEMLDMGFLEDIQEIFKHLPKSRQTLFFSATMPPPICKLAEKILNNPAHVKTIEEAESNTNVDIRQLYYVVDEREREDAVIRLIDDQEPEKAIVFCRTRLEADRLSNFLAGRGYNARALHGDMEQNRRNEVMDAFRKGAVEILVATDIAARGLDVADLSHVFNYHMPFDSKSYIHRIGRTGRAGKKGTAITIVTPREYSQLERIKKQVGGQMEHKEVPCLTQLRIGRLGKLRETLQDMRVKQDIYEMLSKLEKTMSVQDIAARLLSMNMAEQNESGPDHIGFSAADMQAVISREKQGHKRKRGGGGGGGGGYKKGGFQHFRRNRK